MTRKDFVFIAEVIRDSPLNAQAKMLIAQAFATALRTLNPLFDRERFLAAAYPEVYDPGR